MASPEKKHPGSEATATPAPQTTTAVDEWEDEWEEPLAVAQSTTWKFSKVAYNILGFW